MRRVIAPILFILYLAFTSGILVSSHYCMNKLDSTTVFASHDDTCGKCGMHNKDANGCCRDEASLLKIEEDQQAGQAQLFKFSAPEIELPAFQLSIADPVVSSATGSFDESSPPGDPPNLYLRNQVFRI